MNMIKLVSTALALGIFPAAQACQISPTLPTMQFCVDIYPLSATQTATVEIPGTSPSDFTVKRVANAMKVVYKGKITTPKKGEIVIRNEKGSIVTKRPITMVTTDYAAGYDKVVKGAINILKELRH